MMDIPGISLNQERSGFQLCQVSRSAGPWMGLTEAPLEPKAQSHNEPCILLRQDGHSPLTPAQSDDASVQHHYCRGHRGPTS